jgi:acetyl-CoA carboxylase alpha subunit
MAQRQNEPPVLDFERPVVELERKIEELRQFAQGSSELAREIKMLEVRV